MNPYAGRKYVIGGIIVLFGIIFLIRLFFLQVVESSYKSSAERNARQIEIQYPARGLIYDRNGEILVYNEAAYDLMVTPGQLQAFDTVDFCRILDISKSELILRIGTARDYSVLKPSIFLRQISSVTYAVMQEKLYKFPGFFVQPRTLREYPRDIAAHALGFVGEVSDEDIEKNDYYQMGDYIGVTGIELAYEDVLRGVKGEKVFLVDVHNRIKGSYQGGRADRKAEVGKNVVACLDAGLQEYGEKLMTKFRGSIVALEPSTGEILALVTSPAYEPNLLVGRIRSENFRDLSEDTLKPWFNRALMAFYTPGSTFKTVNGAIALQEGVITTSSEFYCDLGFHMGGYSVACHMHPSPLDFRGAVQHSCNAYFNYVYRAILTDPKFESTAGAYRNWREHVLSFGFGDYLHSDFEYERTGFVPEVQYYNNIYGEGHWNFLTVRSLSIGQGELGITPLQMANLAATIANRGFYYTPLSTYSSIFGLVIVSLRYFSAINPAMGAAHIFPKPPCSTYTEMAMRGLSLGANAMNMEWSSPWGFSAVPVLPQTMISAILALHEVPPLRFTAPSMPSATAAKWMESTLVLWRSRKRSSIWSSPSISFIICGV